MSLFSMNEHRTAYLSRVKKWGIFISLLVFSLTSCQTSPPSAYQPQPTEKSSTQKNTAQSTTAPSPSPSLQPSPSPVSPSLWINPALPPDLLSQLTIPDNFQVVPDQDQADLSLGSRGDTILGYWTYCLAAPFPSLAEDLTEQEFIDLWQGEDHPSNGYAKLFLRPAVYDHLSAHYGEPDPASVVVLESPDLLTEIWENPRALSIIPFADLEPRWKVLGIDGQKPTLRTFSDPLYPLSIPISLEGDQSLIDDFKALNQTPENRNPDLLSVVAMTGVTAMVRATAWMMEKEGITYPAQDLLPIFAEADITHVSNEVPFAEDCPEPDLDQPSLYFCSDDQYLELLEVIGTDVVELSGDHFGDWGQEAMLHTLSLYEDHGMLTYGGGINLQAGLQPIQLTHNGNRFAWIGCNAKGGKYATATELKPGSSECDFAWMEAEIGRLSQQGYLVIATMQHDEFYSYQPNYLQIRDFRRLAEAGAVIVSGSQAHQPQAVEFYQAGFIHYGLGNLFFDQFRVAKYVEQFQNSDKAFIDLHTFYDGRYLSTDLRPVIFLDYARSRPMDHEERYDLLQAVFSASGWDWD